MIPPYEGTYHVTPFLQIAFFAIPFCVLPFSVYASLRTAFLRVASLRTAFLRVGSLRYRKIPKISPGAYILQRPFLRGLFLEGLIFGGVYLRREICVSKSIGLAL